MSLSLLRRLQTQGVCCLIADPWSFLLDREANIERTRPSTRGHCSISWCATSPVNARCIPPPCPRAMARTRAVTRW